MDTEMKALLEQVAQDYYFGGEVYEKHVADYEAQAEKNARMGPCPECGSAGATCKTPKDRPRGRFHDQRLLKGRDAITDTPPPWKISAVGAAARQALGTERAWL